MYHFLFWFIYENLRRKGKNPNKGSVAWVVAFIIVIHFGLVYAFLRFTSIISPHPIQNNSYGKYVYLPFAIVFSVIVEIYFRYKFEDIALAYADSDMAKKSNIIKVLLLTILPLIVGILFASNY